MKQKKASFIYLLAAIGAAFIWGFLTIPLKRLHHIGYPSQQILYYRVLTSLVIIWIYNLASRSKIIGKDIRVLKVMQPKERTKVLWLLFATGIFITGNWFSYIYVVNHISVKVAAFAYFICPLLTAGGGFLILKEQLSKIKIAGIVIAILSIVILSTGSFTQMLWSFVVAIFYAAYLVIQRVLTQFDKINMLALQLAISAVMLMPFYIYEFNGLPQSGEFWANITVVAVLFTLVPLLLSLYALTGIPSSTLGITIYINPIMTFVVAFVYFHEAFDQSQLLGYLLLLASVIVFNWEMIGNIFKRKDQIQTKLV
jgi:chloramphenicol-sensitive protein RarD